MGKSKERRQREAEQRAREAMEDSTAERLAADVPTNPPVVQSVPETLTPVAESERRRINEALNNPQERVVRFQGEDLIISLFDRSTTLRSLNKISNYLKNLGRNVPTPELKDEMIVLEKLFVEGFDLESEAWEVFSGILKNYDPIYDEHFKEKPGNYYQELNKFLETDPAKLSKTIRNFRDMGEGINIDGLRANFRRNDWENRDFRRVIRFNENLRWLENLRRGKKQQYQKAKANLNHLLGYFRSEINNDALPPEALADYESRYVGYQGEEFEILLQALEDKPEDSYVERRSPDEIKEAEKAREIYLEDTEDSLDAVNKALKEIKEASEGKGPNQDTFLFWAQPDFEFTIKALEKKQSILRLKSSLLDDFAKRCEEDSALIERQIQKLFEIIRYQENTSNSRLNRISTFVKKVVFKTIPNALLADPTNKKRKMSESLETQVCAIEKIPFDKAIDAAKRMRAVFKGDEGKLIQSAIREFAQLVQKSDFDENKESKLEEKREEVDQMKAGLEVKEAALKKGVRQDKSQMDLLIKTLEREKKESGNNPDIVDRVDLLILKERLKHETYIRFTEIDDENEYREVIEAIKGKNTGTHLDYLPEDDRKALIKAAEEFALANSLFHLPNAAEAQKVGPFVILERLVEGDARLSTQLQKVLAAIENPSDKMDIKVLQGSVRKQLEEVMKEVDESKQRQKLEDTLFDKDPNVFTPIELLLRN